MTSVSHRVSNNQVRIQIKNIRRVSVFHPPFLFISSSFLCLLHPQFSFVFSSLFVSLMHPYFLFVLISLLSTHTQTHTQTHVSGAADLLTKNGESIHFSQLLPHDAGGNMKTVKHPKTTTVNVGDGPPRVVPLDKEDEYAMGMHSPLLFCHLLSSSLL